MKNPFSRLFEKTSSSTAMVRYTAPGAIEVREHKKIALTGKVITAQSALSSGITGRLFGGWAKSYDTRQAIDNADIGWAANCAEVAAAIGSRSEMYVVRVVQEPNLLETRVKDRRHDLTRLLARPNDIQTPAEFFGEVLYSLVFLNEAFIVVDYDHSGATAKPVALWPRRADWMIESYAEDGSGHDGFWYTAPGSNSAEFLKLDQVIHVKYGGLNGSVRPASPIEKHSFTVSTDKAVKAYGNTISENGGRIDFVMELDTTDDDQMAKATERLKADIQNAKREGGVLSIGTGAKLTPLSLKPSDMEFVKLASMTRDEILSAYRTPPCMFGLAADGAGASGPAAAEARKAYLSDRIDRDLYAIASKIGHVLLPKYKSPKAKTITYEVGYVSPVSNDTEERAKIHNLQIKNGTRTPNEIRSIEGFAPLEGEGSGALSPNGVMQKTIEEMQRVKLEMLKVKLEQMKAGGSTASATQGQTPDAELNQDQAASEAELATPKTEQDTAA